MACNFPLARGLAAAIALGLLTASPVLAQGQPQRGERQPEGGRRAPGGGGFMGGMGMGGGMQQMFEPPVTSRDLDRYAKVLELDKEQTEALSLLLEAHQQEFSETAREARTKMDRLREEAREARDPAVWREMGAQMETFQTSRQKLEAGFLADFRAVLTDAQAERWPKIERQRRREQTIGRGLMSGERLDLIRTMGELELAPEETAGIQATLEQYEADLDRELAARNAIYEQSRSRIRELFESGNTDDMQKLLERGREASKRVRDVNRRYARQLETQLPDAARDRFAEQVRRESFPLIYRPSAAARTIDAAIAFDDLAPDQTAALEAIRDSYIRESGALNKQLEQATLEREENITAQDLMSRGMGGFGGDDGPLGELRTKRRELDTATLDKVRGVLSPEQVERLPRRDERFGPGGDRGERGGDRRPQQRRRPGGDGDDAPPPDRRV